MEIQVRYSNHLFDADCEAVGTVYTFSLKATRQSNKQFECIECKKIAKTYAVGNRPKVAMIKVDIATQTFLDDPLHPTNDHICAPIPKSKSIAKQMDRSTRPRIRTHGVKPRTAYQDLRALVTETYGNNAQQRDEVLQSVKPYGSVRSGYYKNYATQYPTINALNDIPQELKLTLKGALFEYCLKF